MIISFRKLTTFSMLSIASLQVIVNADLIWLNESEDYGYVWQLALSANHQLDGESCLPTSWTNSMVYLQHEHAAELNGVQLVQSGFSGWTKTVLMLRSSEFMNTSFPEGTSGYYQVTGLENYLNSTGAGPLATNMQGMISAAGYVPLSDGEEYPGWLLQCKPTFGQLHNWLKSGAVVVVDIIYANSGADDGHIGGHAAALVGLHWVDSNGDGIIDQDENATLNIIDPMDPSQSYGPKGAQAIGPAKLTEVSVWQSTDPETAGYLLFSYQQYGGGYPVDWLGVPYDPTAYGTASGVVGGAGATFIIGGPAGSCCLVTGCDAITQDTCNTLGGTWTVDGSCDDCPEYCAGDTNNDGFVNLDDLLRLISNWGVCP